MATALNQNRPEVFLYIQTPRDLNAPGTDQGQTRAAFEDSWSQGNDEILQIPPDEKAYSSGKDIIESQKTIRPNWSEDEKDIDSSDTHVPCGEPDPNDISASNSDDSTDDSSITALSNASSDSSSDSTGLSAATSATLAITRPALTQTAQTTHAARHLQNTQALPPAARCTRVNPCGPIMLAISAIVMGSGIYLLLAGTGQAPKIDAGHGRIDNSGYLVTGAILIFASLFPTYFGASMTIRDIWTKCC